MERKGGENRREARRGGRAFEEVSYLTGVRHPFYRAGMKKPWRMNGVSVKSDSPGKFPFRKEIGMDKRGRFWYNGSVNLAKDSFGEKMSNSIPNAIPNRFASGSPAAPSVRPNSRGTRSRPPSRLSGVPFSAVSSRTGFAFPLPFVPLGRILSPVRKEDRP